MDSDCANADDAMQEEQQHIYTAVDGVRDVAAALWEHSRTVLFGSQATGLALPGSDLDIVVLGVSEDMSNAAAGFTRFVGPGFQLWFKSTRMDKLCCTGAVVSCRGPKYVQHTLDVFASH